jgi:protein-tyrosine phosphatase
MIDLHCHVLPDIDDGPDTIEQSLMLARASAAVGTRTILATSHVNWHYPNDVETLARLTEELNARLQIEAVPLRILPGAEVALTYALEQEPTELLRFGLGGGPWVLIEPPFTPVVANLDLMLLNLQSTGIRILLAHPERCPALQREPRMIESLVDAGVLTSITAGSLVGRFGSEVQRFSLELAQKGLIHNVASDTHDTTRRPPGIIEELKRSGLGEMSQWLTAEVPAAILSGGEIPPRPEVSAQEARSPRRSPWQRRTPLKRAL